MKNDHTLSSWIDPVTYEQMGELLVNHESQQNNDLSTDEWWEKLKKTQQAIDTASPESSADRSDSENLEAQAPTGPKGVASPLTQRPEALPRTAISSIREKLDTLEPKSSTHQNSPEPAQTEPETGQEAEPEAELKTEPETEPETELKDTAGEDDQPPSQSPEPLSRSPLSPDLNKLQLPKPQQKATEPAKDTPPSTQSAEDDTRTESPGKSKDQTQRALDRYIDWVMDYLSFSKTCLMKGSGDIMTGDDFDSSFTTAASTLGRAFLNASRFQLENADPDDEIHQFPHRAAHTPWKDQYLAVIPVNTSKGLCIIAGLTTENIERQKACMAAETLLRITGAPED